MFDQIESLKQQYTDQYVMVDESVPELARFGGHVGQVKTVNMNGRALVQFDTWNNIGWYDIELDCLRVVPKPEPGAAEAKKKETKEAAPKPAAKAAAVSGEKKLSPLEMARMQGAAKGGAAPAAGGAKKSTSDILAAARANKGAAPAADKPAAEKPAAKPAAPTGKMSTADILAAARAKKAAEASAAAPEAEPQVEAPAPEPASEAPAPKSGGTTTLKPGVRPSVPEILAWCREHDSK